MWLQESHYSRPTIDSGIMMKITSKHDTAVEVGREGESSSFKSSDVGNEESSSRCSVSSSSVKESPDSARGSVGSESEQTKTARRDTSETSQQRSGNAATPLQAKSTSEEETALHDILNHFHSFNFDKAKEQAVSITFNGKN